MSKFETPQDHLPQRQQSTPFHDEAIFSRCGTPNSVQDTTGSHTEMQALPDSAIQRLKCFAQASAQAFPAGFAHSIIGADHIEFSIAKNSGATKLSFPVPVLLENAALGASIGYLAKNILPQTGCWGKIAAAALGITLAAPLVNSGVRIFDKSKSARNLSELKSAGSEMGWCAGSLAGAIPTGSLAYSAASKFKISALRPEQIGLDTLPTLSGLKTRNAGANYQSPTQAESLGSVSRRLEACIRNGSTSKDEHLSPLEQEKSVPLCSEVASAHRISDTASCEWRSSDLLDLLASKDSDFRSLGRDAVNYFHSDLLSEADRYDVIDSLDYVSNWLPKR